MINFLLVSLKILSQYTFGLDVLAKSAFWAELHWDKVELSIFQNIICKANKPPLNSSEASHFTVEQMFLDLCVDLFESNGLNSHR